MKARNAGWVLVALAAFPTGCVTLRDALGFEKQARSGRQLGRIEGRIDTEAPAEGARVTSGRRAMARSPSYAGDTMRVRPLAWLGWAACLGGWALECVLAYSLARAEPWSAAQTAVAEFVLAIFSLVAGVGTFVLRETFALGPIRRGDLDPDTPAGLRRLRAALFALWSLCLLIGAFGVVIAWGAALPHEAWPYLAGALLLLLLYAPRAWVFRPGEATPLTPRP